MGAGKTTLLDVICGKVKPMKGRVIFGENDVNITGMSDHEIVKMRIGRKFQAPLYLRILPCLKILSCLYEKTRVCFLPYLCQRQIKIMRKYFQF